MSTAERSARHEPAVPPSRVPLRGSVIGSVAVVLCEFVLLMGVYWHGQSVTAARVTLAQYAGVVNASAAAAEAGTTAAVLSTLRHEGVSTAALRVLSEIPSGPAAASERRAAVAALDRTLLARQHRLDDEAKIGYGALILIASLGWMVWFHKLIVKHRALEHDVTEQLARAESEARLAALIRNSTDLVVVCDAESTVLFATHSARTVLGIEPESLQGRVFSDLLEPEYVARFMRALTSDRLDDRNLALRMRNQAQAVIDVEGTVTDLTQDPSVGGFVLTVRDVTDRLQLQEQLSRQAFQDSISGLANRQLFADRLTHALERRLGADEPLVVLLCDLDDFKNINDSLGHNRGDEVLALMGERVRSVIRQGDTAARLGGDEFAMLMEDTDLASATMVADRLQAAISEPISIAGIRLTVHASIGLAQAVPGEMTSEEALRNADVAMYLAKDRGKFGVAVYESALHAQALDRLELRDDLQRALRAGEGGLVLYYQPTVDLKTNQVLGFEALIRWTHPTRGFLPPGLFIPMAEECGLIAPLGSWVLNEACRAGSMMGSDGRGPSIAINVAAEQLAHPGFVDEVITALDESGLAYDRLTLEITEGVILDDLQAIAPRLVALRERGVRIAIDDFGTGYSSLAYLSQLPVDILKVDKSFVDRVTIDKQDASVTAAIIAMGQTMNMKIVAEGVEQFEQAQWLREVRCDIGQGFLWSRPVPFEQAYNLVGTQLGQTDVVAPAAAVDSGR